MLRSTLLTFATLSLVGQTPKPEEKPKPVAAVTTTAPVATAQAPKEDKATPKEDKIVGKVGNELIRQSDIEMGLSGVAPQQRKEVQNDPEARDRYVKSFVEFRLLVAKGRKMGLENSDFFKKRLSFAADQIIATELMNRDAEVLKKKIELTEPELKAYYEAHKDKFQTTADTYSARHILVKIKANADDKEGLSDADAKAKIAKVQAELKAGKKLADLAKEYSDDPGSKDTGGLYEGFDPSQMVPEFGNAVKSQAIGVVGEPVKTQFGYHLIEVTDKKLKGAQRPFEAVSKEIPALAQPERQEKVWNEYLDGIKKEIPFELYLVPVSETAAPATPVKATPKPATEPKKPEGKTKKVEGHTKKADDSATPKKNS